MASWMGGWRCAGHGASSGIGPKHSTACLVSGSLGGEEACNAWLHHACLRTKGRMVSNHNHEIASLRASRGGGAALIQSPTTSQFVLHTHKPIMHLYPVVIYRTRVAVSTYLRLRVSLVFFVLSCCRSMRETFAIGTARPGMALPQIYRHNVSKLRPRREQRGLDQI